jgi:hypothetical protein
MGSSHTLDQLDICFDDTHAVANAGLLLAATLADLLGDFGFDERLEHQREPFTDDVQVVAGAQCIQQLGQGCEGSRRKADRLLIRPATMVGQSGAGSSRTDQDQGTSPDGQWGLGHSACQRQPASTQTQAPQPQSQ